MEQRCGRNGQKACENLKWCEGKKVQEAEGTQGREKKINFSHRKLQGKDPRKQLGWMRKKYENTYLLYKNNRKEEDKGVIRVMVVVITLFHFL